MKKNKTTEPTVEQCLLKLCEHPRDRFQEIVDMVSAVIGSAPCDEHGARKLPSVSEIIAQREATLAGVVYHAIVGLSERIELLREAVMKSNSIMSDKFACSMLDFESATKLLEDARPTPIHPDDLEDGIGESGNGNEAKA